MIPGAADRNLLSQAYRASEDVLVERAMLEDKIRATGNLILGNIQLWKKRCTQSCFSSLETFYRVLYLLDYPRFELIVNTFLLIS
jgi:hypothetical protein